MVRLVTAKATSTVYTTTTAEVLVASRGTVTATISGALIASTTGAVAGVSATVPVTTATSRTTGDASPTLAKAVSNDSRHKGTRGHTTVDNGTTVAMTVTVLVTTASDSEGLVIAKIFVATGGTVTSPT